MKKLPVWALTGLALVIPVKGVWTEEAPTPTSTRDINADKATMFNLRVDVNKDTAALKADSKEVAARRAIVRTDLKAYNDAVNASGKDSPQAKAAEATLNKAQIALHKELGNMWADSHDLRKDSRALAQAEIDLKQNNDPRIVSSRGTTILQ